MKPILSFFMVGAIALLTVAAGNHFDATVPSPQGSPKALPESSGQGGAQALQEAPKAAQVDPIAGSPRRQDPKTVRTVGQIARGMRRIVEIRDGGHWWSCGIPLTPEDQEEESTRIAWALVQEVKGLGLELDPWGIAATMYNESGLDPCALGLNPRRWAYKKGLLKPRRACISHTMTEVLAVVESPAAVKQFKTSGFDLGLCQVLSRFYRETPFADMLTVAGGARICALEMEARARYHKTRIPWTYWRGHHSNWYTAKINRWRRIMRGRS